jgi:iron complex transport system substrate-binding protein
MRLSTLLSCLVFALAVAPSAPAAETSGRSLLDAEGQDVVVPQQAQRVVTLSEIDLDSALALGLTPVGAINGRGQTSLPHYLQSAETAGLVKGIQIVGDLGRPNVEAIIKLKPDLILTSALRPEVLELMRKIAPTFVSFKNGDNWKDVLGRVAAAVGREQQAAAFMAGYEKELRAARAKLAGVSDKTVSIVRWNPNGPAFMYQDSFASLVLRDMGLERPASQRIAGERHSMPLSMEALDKIDAGWLFIGTLDPRGDAADAMQTVAKSSSFQRLSAVKSKRYFPVDGSKWTSIGGPLAALSIVKETSAMLSPAGH